MASRFVKQFADGAKKVSILLAEEVQDRGYKRIVDAIDPATVAQTADDVAKAYNGSAMLTESQKAQVCELLIMYDRHCICNRRRLMPSRSMPHPSPEDPDPHSTILMKNQNGQKVCVGHVTTDPNKQKVRSR